VTEPLDRVVFSRQIVDGQPGENLDVVALSENLALEEALTWRNFVSLDPALLSSDGDSRAVGIFHGPANHFILARANLVPDSPESQLYEHILLPGDLLSQMAGDLSPLLALIEEPISAYPSEIASIPQLAPHPPTWTDDKRIALFNRLFAAYSNFEALLTLLGASLTNAICRLRIFQAILPTGSNLFRV
jgi:hypothetical protein